MSTKKLSVVVGTKTWTKEKLWDWIRTDDAALKRALLKIYGKQSAEERATHTTCHDNGVGFNAWDAEKMTEYAVRVSKGITIRPNELAEIRGRMKKYCGQLLYIISVEQTRKGQAA